MRTAGGVGLERCCLVRMFLNGRRGLLQALLCYYYVCSIRTSVLFAVFAVAIPNSHSLEMLGYIRRTFFVGQLNLAEMLALAGA